LISFIDSALDNRPVIDLLLFCLVWLLSNKITRNKNQHPDNGRINYNKQKHRTKKKQKETTAQLGA